MYPSGKVCLSILNEYKGWKPSITVKQILVGVKELLDNHNNADAAQEAAYRLFKKSGAEYSKRVRIEAAKYTEAPVDFVATGGGATGAEDDVIVLLRTNVSTDSLVSNLVTLSEVLSTRTALT